MEIKGTRELGLGGHQLADSPTEQELEEKYSPGRKLIGRITLQELLERDKLVEAASKGQYSKRLQQGADRGASVMHLMPL